MGKLFLVPTPIGNLKDITFRSIEVLKAVDLILAEDTRNSGKLLKHYNIFTKMTSFHMHNEHKKVDEMISMLVSGSSLAIISDAGTPAISDPGYLIVKKCLESHIEVDCLPGPTALIPALVNSGLPNNKFVFEGFLPAKKGRQTKLTELADEKRTIALYESPHKLVKTLKDICFYFGEDRDLSISRELSKMFEETKRGSASYLLEYFTENKAKGEIVIIIRGSN